MKFDVLERVQPFLWIAQLQAGCPGSYLGEHVRLIISIFPAGTRGEPSSRPSPWGLRDDGPKKCGYVLVCVVDAPFPVYFRRDDISELRMGSPGQPVGDRGDLVHSFLQAA